MQITPMDTSIRLTNNGSLEFFFIGVGSAFSKIHYQNNLLIVKGQDHLLIDCGTLCPFAFYKYNSNIISIKNILITHSHADHIGGLEEMALLGPYAPTVRQKMVITNEYKKILWNQRLRGGNGYGEYTAHCLGLDDYFEQLQPKLISKKPR